MASLISQLAATAISKSTAAMEKVKINSVISNLEGERTNLTQLLGQKIFDMHKEHGQIVTDERILNFINEINKRLESIAHQNELLKRVDEEVAMVKGTIPQTSSENTECSSCEHLNRPGAKFCAGCGNPI